ncbi:MFS transporter [Yersinia pseudotuberculosis]|uniref:MFS Superfamily multidrug efflux transporter n=2 Tax=Yersinia pseudotuberculosis complex TaxID=1649845 RepID=A0ABM9TF99_9GAMM|nr:MULTISPECIES: MFS transporter [Yersinia pseudotuberculosis complex]PSH22182.1 MFS transporter [Yersinia pseudotuberculosis]CNC01262.1 putative MFS Superfamily multidrug efflux transporter [Yersinia pseudotuberculosis]CRG50459.1 putative MFS Superfamily multidrug efflux transporter [Yersinia wautersii]CRY72982.1 putative MFS Superfamily multidrug efflux transporter [Yersinia pseudotuberculosis]SUP82412.1 putative MFS Superfamily multidrug efflux transporter [Yersinia pseudotuberculosis]
MANQSVSRTGAEVKESWVPMITIALAQILMSFNVASLPVALGGMVKSFNVPPTTIATAIVMYSLSVAGFVMLGAKLNQRFGPLIVFRCTVLLFGLAQTMMTFSPNVSVMIGSQALSGLAGAALVPALVALIAENYRGPQQATALGALGSARAGAGVAAFLIGGILGTHIGWRPAFGILIVLSAIVFVLSFRLKADKGRPEVGIDIIGVVLAASAIILLSFGFNNLNRWGFGLVRDGAPFDLLGFSPAPFMIVLGIVLGQAFVVWTRRRQEQGKTPLLALDVITSPSERAAVFAMFAVVALEAMLNFSVPLYIQIVQGSSPMATAIAMMPFNLSVFFSAMLIVRFYKKLTPRKIGRYGFITCTLALLWLAFVVRNNWSEWSVLIGLVVFGIGQGSLVTLLFNVLVSASPKELAGDVGSLRGTTNNLASAIGTAVAGALLVGLLSANVMRGVAETPILTDEIQAQVNMDSINFVSNDRLNSVLAQTSATPEQVAEAVRVNEEARLRALKFGLLVMALLSLLAIFPAGRLPDYLPGELPADNLDKKASK